MAPVRPLLTVSLLCLLALAGCMQPKDAPAAGGLPTTVPEATTEIARLVETAGKVAMTFTQSVVTPAKGLGSDLYEPTMEVSDTGTLYVAAHVIGAATTGTPAYYSNDDGATWKVLPMAGPVAVPSPGQGSQPPPGDEGFIVAGDGGQAWMADIYAAGFSVTGWCDDGARECYDNRYAYDRVQSTTTSCGDGARPDQGTTAASLNDRPWAAYAKGTLLLVNNPGGGPMQIGVMKVPPATPVGLFDPVTGPKWNLCASPDGWIPGVPAMRPDLFFAVPQIAGSGADQRLTIVTGNAASIGTTQVRDAFPVTSASGGTSNGGRTAFDATGTLFVGAYNNTKADAKDGKSGHFILATSTDSGGSFRNVTFATTSPLQSLYLDSNLKGAGALLTWSQVGSTEGRADWYVAHVFVGPNGEPELRNVNLAVDEGSPYSAHVMGAAVGPDGRAYFVNFKDASDPLQYAGSTPLSVWVQQDGPTLPVA
ncbi:MAG TPA: hypothetical protein VM286_08905 [Candidatus Thermoplasmatota archaeon]|nr:hypothetical protein [Candidatus Thermoplasmatota archaeon]